MIYFPAPAIFSVSLSLIFLSASISLVSSFPSFLTAVTSPISHFLPFSVSPVFPASTTAKQPAQSSADCVLCLCVFYQTENSDAK